MCHHMEKISHKKKFFIKSFIVSLVLLIIFWLIGMFAYEFFANTAYKMYGIDADDYAKNYTLIMCLWKILIIQFTLVPAIAMCMLEKQMKKEDYEK